MHLPGRLICLATCISLAMGGEAHPWRENSPCDVLVFEGSRFTVCADAGEGMNVETYSTDHDGRTLSSFADFERAYPGEAQYVRFGMNAGMFQVGGRPLGLLVQGGSVLNPLNRGSGWGNFYLKPNGVFYIGANGAAVTPSDKFRMTPEVSWATQSGPMLVIDGKLNPALKPDGESRYIRNGVGVDAKGEPYFVISEDRVSFGKLARFFRDVLHTPNALYLDGSVSALWDPERGRKDDQQLGPMIVAFDFPE